MNPIRELLDKYTRFASPDSAVRKALVHSVKDIVGFDVPERSITMVNGSAYINIEPIMKSAIFMRQEEVIEQTNKRLGKILLIGVR